MVIKDRNSGFYFIKEIKFRACTGPESQGVYFIKYLLELDKAKYLVHGYAYVGLSEIRPQAWE
jgi:hypothetical protein